MMKLTLVVLLSLTAVALGEQEKRLVSGLTNILSGNGESGAGCINLMSLLRTLGYDTKEAFFEAADLNGDNTVSNAEVRMLVQSFKNLRANGNAGAASNMNVGL